MFRTARGTPLRAAVFDTDGVVTDTADRHATAWKAAFDPWLQRSGRSPFDMGEDYLRFVDGKPRLDGVRAFAAGRGLNLPEGSPDDPPGDGSLHALAARKEQLFVTGLRRGAVRAWPDAVRLLDAFAAAGIPCAAASASRHARQLLQSAGVLGRFAAVVDGWEADRLGLAGKPDPALFLEAVRRLGRFPAATALFEDAEAGVEAGRRGGFGLVVGVDRRTGSGTRSHLLGHGADLVVRTLDAVS